MNKDEVIEKMHESTCEHFECDSPMGERDKALYEKHYTLLQQHFGEMAVRLADKEILNTEDEWLSDYDKLANHRINRVKQALTEAFGLNP